MSLLGATKYVSDSSQSTMNIWRHDELLASSMIAPPDLILAKNGVILKADVYALWFRWFVEGLCNPLRYMEESKTIINVLADTRDRVNKIFASEPQDEREALSEKIAQHVMAEVQRHRQLKRIGASSIQKRELVDAAVNNPRCWMCGFEFSQIAIDRFLRKPSREQMKLPQFVDILRPRGLYLRDESIEVEHIIPVAAGGGGFDNLALACGWCNKIKGARTSIYDADARAPRITFHLGSQIWHELPHPYWTVRLLAVRRRCEHIDGCSSTVDNSELFIAPTDPRGSPNPSNLHIFCKEHDPYATTRIYGREEARKIWERRLR